MKRTKFFEGSPWFSQAILLLISFGAGFTTNQLVETLHKSQFKQESYQPAVYLKEPTTSVCFTPNKKCQVQIIEAIRHAKHSIFVQAYSFTDRYIAQALVEAAQRGVQVYALLDKSNRNDKRSAKDLILYNNIPLRFDSPSGIAHNKIIIIDQLVVLSGSYNFSEAAYKRNTENLLVLNHPLLAKKYLENWRKRWEASKER